MEAIIPIEIGVPKLRTKIPEKANTKAIVKDLDMADKLREVVCSTPFRSDPIGRSEPVPGYSFNSFYLFVFLKVSRPKSPA